MRPRRCFGCRCSAACTPTMPLAARSCRADARHGHCWRSSPSRPTAPPRAARPRPFCRSRRENRRARASLRQAVHELQQALGSAAPRLLRTDRHHLALAVQDAWIDAVSWCVPRPRSRNRSRCSRSPCSGTCRAWTRHSTNGAPGRPRTSHRSRAASARRSWPRRPIPPVRYGRPNKCCGSTPRSRPPGAWPSPHTSRGTTTLPRSPFMSAAARCLRNMAGAPRRARSRNWAPPSAAPSRHPETARGIASKRQRPRVQSRPRARCVSACSHYAGSSRAPTRSWRCRWWRRSPPPWRNFAGSPAPPIARQNNRLSDRCKGRMPIPPGHRGARTPSSISCSPGPSSAAAGKSVSSSSSAMSAPAARWFGDAASTAMPAIFSRCRTRSRRKPLRRSTPPC